jgi:phage baseplate assembly protein W
LTWKEELQDEQVTAMLMFSPRLEVRKIVRQIGRKSNKNPFSTNSGPTEKEKS